MTSDMSLAMVINAICALDLPSAAKHVLIVCAARQFDGETDWPGLEALALDSSIPSNLIELSIRTLRQRGLLRIFRSIGCKVHSFSVETARLNRAAFGRQR